METQSGPARQVVRRRAERKIAGVAAGLADYVGIDPIWMRLLFVLLLFAGGIGLVAYIALWILMPATDEPSKGERLDARDVLARFRGSTFGTIVIGIGVLIVATQVFDRRPGLFWGLALIALGLYLFRERDATPMAPRAELEGRARVDPRAARTTSPVPRAPRPRRERSPLGWLTLGALLVLVGTLWLVDVATGVSVRLVQYLALSLVVLGIGIGIGAIRGRARWLILPALLLLPLTVLASAITVPFEGGHGRRHIEPERFADLDSEYRLATGALLFDLRGIAQPGAARAVNASVALGSVVIYLPPDVPVDVRAHAGVGFIKLEDREHGYLDTTVARRFGPTERPAVLHFDVQTSIGAITVQTSERR